MCISVKGETQLQLVRQLTAAALNCVMSGGDGNCTGVSIQDLQADCNAACVGDPSDRTMNECIDEIDCFNNGGDWDGGICTYGTGLCEISGEDCSDDVGCPGLLDTCVAFETCHDRDLCPDGGDLCIEPPHPASSSKACTAAADNDIYVP
jgi:hypothetical protein